MVRHYEPSSNKSSPMRKCESLGDWSPVHTMLRDVPTPNSPSPYQPSEALRSRAPGTPARPTCSGHGAQSPSRICFASRRRQTGRPAAHLRGRLRRRFRSRHLQTGHPAERRRAPTPNERCFNRRAGTNTFPEERLCGQTGHPTTRRCGQTGGRHRRRHQGRRPRAAPPPLRCQPCRCRRRCRRRASACRWSGRIPPGRS